MQRRVFLDIGACTGQSLRVALRYGFDRLYAFEPNPQSLEQLGSSVLDPRVAVCPFGLLDRDGEHELHLASTKGASLYRRLTKHGEEARIVLVPVRRASKWFVTHIEPADRVCAKFNCEGAEVAIINDLLDAGLYARLHRVLVRLDGLKLPELHDAALALLAPPLPPP